jgi:hypothetical protein
MDKKKILLREILPIKKGGYKQGFSFSILSWKWIGNHPQEEQAKIG